jgi:hypothetical protein
MASTVQATRWQHRLLLGLIVTVSLGLTGCLHNPAGYPDIRVRGVPPATRFLCLVADARDGLKLMDWYFPYPAIPILSFTSHPNDDQHSIFNRSTDYPHRDAPYLGGYATCDSTRRGAGPGQLGSAPPGLLLWSSLMPDDIDQRFPPAL